MRSCSARAAGLVAVAGKREGWARAALAARMRSGIVMERAKRGHMLTAAVR
jgi:hypothetical protein